jgi:hypothetical protein
MASGGVSGPLQFKFVLYNQRTNTWNVAQDFGSSNTFAWTTTTDDAGVYALQVWVKSGGTSGLDDWASSGYFQLR